MQQKLKRIEWYVQISVLPSLLKKLPSFHCKVDLINLTVSIFGSIHMFGQVCKTAKLLGNYIMHIITLFTLWLVFNISNLVAVSFSWIWLFCSEFCPILPPAPALNWTGVNSQLFASTTNNIEIRKTQTVLLKTID